MSLGAASRTVSPWHLSGKVMWDVGDKDVAQSCRDARVPAGSGASRAVSIAAAPHEASPTLSPTSGIEGMLHPRAGGFLRHLAAGVRCWVISIY